MVAAAAPEAAPQGNATGTTEGTAGAAEWRPAFRTLLLSRSAARRRAALERLLRGYEEASAELLAEVAAHGEAARTRPWWSRLRLRPLLGYRSACASLHRTMLEHVLPAQAGSSVKVQRRAENGTERVRYVLRDDTMDGDIEDKVADADQQSPQAAEQGEEEDTASKARALVVLLRQLSTATPWELEAGAATAKGQEGTGSFEQWLERTPKLETPEYEVVFNDPAGAFEVRKYAPYSVVQTGGDSSERRSGNSYFFALAGYIFGKANVEQEKMAMTTPVQVDRRTGAMSFIMPSKYWGEEALQAAPAPTEDAGVRLQSRPGETIAVSVFGGYARGRAVAERTEALLSALKQRDDMEVVDPSEIRLMQYNDPFTVPWKRRNEVSVPVVMK